MFLGDTVQEKEKVLILFFFGKDAWAKRALARVDIMFSESYILKKLSKKLKQMSKEERQKFDEEINSLIF